MIKLCYCCRGKKKIHGMGYIEQDCSVCNAVGYINDSDEGGDDLKKVGSSQASEDRRTRLAKKRLKNLLDEAHLTENEKSQLSDKEKRQKDVSQLFSIVLKSEDETFHNEKLAESYAKNKIKRKPGRPKKNK